ncbi:hypothetical protein TSAR_012180 [Trichomalopsis sarcophagae]|uniref:Ionotropic glutamate receptor C-terminal domain-containing protein n=1 Tax=Trichomalopsis sarcophagae TaxID=543379 RepID=A0A232EI31_9HYME|nr:hypothetical protein TSAR_012180 [Trichomalopsis sarcophagae]
MIPQHTTKRILLIMFIIIAFVVNSCLFGYLTAIDSTSNRLPVIDTYDDLMNSDMTICGMKNIEDLKESIACIAPRFYMGHYVNDSELFHVSKTNLVERSFSYWFAEDFPLFAKMQSLLLNMNEGGFVTLLLNQEAFNDHAEFSENYKVTAVEMHTNIKISVSELKETLLDTCVNKKRDNNILLFVGNADHCTTFYKFSFSRNIPIHLFQINAKLDSRREFRESYLSDETQIAKYHKPTSCAVIIISNTKEFKKLMLKIKNSIWWEHEAYFVIVNLDHSNSCQLAHVFLKQVWSFNILSAIYICKHFNGQEEVYTFNPYAGIASKVWTKVGLLDNNTTNPYWSLFKLPFEPKSTLPRRGGLICNHLFFDKTNTLHGTNVKVALIKSNILHYDSTKIGYKRFTSPSFLLIAGILNYINATITVKFSNEFGYINNFGEPEHALKDVIFGTVSIGLNLRYLRNSWKFQVYSFYADSVAIATLKKQTTFIEQLEKLGLTFYLYLLIASLALTAALKYILKQSMSLAALNYMRICLGNPSTTVPQHTPRRILLIWLINVAFVINSYVLSYFTAMESSSNRSPIIDTYDDLIKSDLALMGPRGLKELTGQREIQNRFELVADDRIKDCFNLLLKDNNSSIACVSSRSMMEYFIRESELIHISKYNLVNSGKSYWFAEDFPLFSKIQSLLLRMSEGGFVKLIFAREAFYHRVRFSENYAVKPIEIEKMYYIFTILIGSWALGVLVLCFDVVTHKLKFLARKLCKRYAYGRKSNV